jgi:N-acyl-D-aspartate/D-glutamate deacylase
VQSVAELITIAEKAGLPGEVFHLKVAHKPSWGVRMDSIRMIVDAARARERRRRGRSLRLHAGGTGLEATIPSWAFDGGNDSLKARLANPATRARLKNEQKTGSPGWWNIIEAAGGWDGVILVNARNPANAKYEQKSLSEIARLMNKEPADAAMDLVSRAGARDGHLPYDGRAGHRDGAQVPVDEHRQRRRRDHDVRSARSDGPAASAVVRNATRVIAEYVKKRHVLTLEEAVRKMTSWPATRMRLANRG